MVGHNAGHFVFPGVGGGLFRRDGHEARQIITGTGTEDDGSQSVIAAGGANFPQAAPGASTPEERGPKTYYQDICLLYTSRCV